MADIFHPELPLDRIEPSPSNPRQHIAPEDLEELRRSIQTHGVLQPILVRPHPSKESWYQIIFGECRWRASKGAGLQTIRAFERDCDDKTVAELQLVENLQRSDVHELDEAKGYARLIDEHGYTAQDIEKRIGKSKKYVYDRLKLLALIPDLQQLFYKKEFTAGHAILLARRRETDQQWVVDTKAYTGSVRELGRAIQRKPETKTAKRETKQPLIPTSVNFHETAIAIIEAAQQGDEEARKAISEIMSAMGLKGASKRWAKRKVQTSAQRKRKG